ncbi:MAG: secretion protein HlyD family protein [Rhodospirillales bacterium]|nr:secretion protein HlyD family protein [Rhodospirillales bacterium]
MRPRLLAIAAIAAIAVAAGVAAAIVLRGDNGPRAPIGMARTTEIKIAPEVSGRVAAIPHKEGDRVAAGTVLVELESPELTAAVAEARATVGQAQATRDRIYAGPRRELVDMAAREVEKAKANVTLAEQQFTRTSALASSATASEQALDTARAGIASARADLIAAEAAHRKAARGPTAEERALADRKVAQADASLAVALRRAEKLRVVAPVDGTIGTVVAELGEATVPRRTSLILVASDAPWFAFNVREDELGGIAIGARVGLVAAGDGEAVAATVTEIRRLGDFATWRAARAVGDYDLNTFFVRTDPVQPGTALEPGRTVWIRR